MFFNVHSKELYKNLFSAAQDRCVEIVATCLTSNKYRGYEDTSMSYMVVQQDFEMADIRSHDIDCAEVHNSIVFGKIYQAEMMQLCSIGEGRKLGKRSN